jgi:hypothetical protein
MGEPAAIHADQPGLREALAQVAGQDRADVAHVAGDQDTHRLHSHTRHGALLLVHRSLR